MRGTSPPGLMPRTRSWTLAQGHGVSITLTAVRALKGEADVTHCNTTKAGVIGLTLAMAREVVTRRLLIGVIVPGSIRTPMLDGETDEWRNGKLAELPSGRFGGGSEVRRTVAMLASEDGSHYVGQTLDPNGGDVML